MDSIIGDFYVIDNKVLESRTINYSFDISEYHLYEVLRTSKGILLFLEDHLLRLENAMKKIGIHDLYFERELRENLYTLINRNGNMEGNVKFLCKITGSKIVYTSYYIPHSYPSEKLYKEGVELSTFLIERDTPGLKQININNFIKNKLGSLSASQNAYDILLVNDKGLITEGSRSNFFLIKGNVIYTAAENLILPGVTRRYVLKIARENNIEIKEIEIKVNEISNFEAAFISGTSPKILAVNKINEYSFKPDHQIIKIISNKFDEIYNDYLKSRSQ